jgi:hypothetical protein
MILIAVPPAPRTTTPGIARPDVSSSDACESLAETCSVNVSSTLCGARVRVVPSARLA